MRLMQMYGTNHGSEMKQIRFSGSVSANLFVLAGYTAWLHIRVTLTAITFLRSQLMRSIHNNQNTVMPRLSASFQIQEVCCHPAIHLVCSVGLCCRIDMTELCCRQQ